MCRYTFKDNAAEFTQAETHMTHMNPWDFWLYKFLEHTMNIVQNRKENIIAYRQLNLVCGTKICFYLKKNKSEQ